MPDQIDLAVDRDTCISAAFCTAAAPDRFALDDDHKSSVLESPTVDDEAVRDALESCPVEAISARDPGTGELLFPPD